MPEEYMEGLVTLSSAPPGSIVRVVRVDVRGRGPYRRLLELGVYPGATLRVVSNSLGPVIVEKNGARLAIGRRHASRILVEVLGYWAK